MPLDPEHINLGGLPRDPLGGYKAGPAEELLERVASDYRQLVHERDTLREAAGALRRQVDELETQATELRGRLEERRAPDEVARNLLAAAQRMARELREAARTDSGVALKKARARARSIEAEARRRSDAAVRAQHLGAEVRRQLRATLEMLVEGALADDGTDTLDASDGGHHPVHVAGAD